MGSMPMARCCRHARHRLQAEAALVQPLEEVAARAVDEQDVGVGVLRYVVEDSPVRGYAEFEERVVQPRLVFKRDECAAPLCVDRSRLRIERVQAQVRVPRAVIEEAGVEDVLWCHVVLQAKQVVASPFFPSVGAGGLLFDDRESVLQAEEVGKPKPPALDRSRKRKSGIPVSEVRAFLNVNTGDRIRRAKAPAVISVGSLEA